jgi:hypothetical protein
MKLSVLIILATLPLFSACATATRGTHERVMINSEPVGATALSDIASQNAKNTIDGFIGCEPTPCGLNISRKAAPVITVSKDGYQPIKFKIISSNATSATSVPTGAIVAGIAPGSYVKAGSPDLLKRIPIGGAIIAGGLFSFGGGIVLDAATGAGRSLSPNPVTAYLAPLPETKANIIEDEKETVSGF